MKAAKVEMTRRRDRNEKWKAWKMTQHTLKDLGSSIRKRRWSERKKVDVKIRRCAFAVFQAKRKDGVLVKRGGGRPARETFALETTTRYQLRQSVNKHDMVHSFVRR